MDLSLAAENLTKFLLGKDELKNSTRTIVFKSPVYRDFLFAYHYLEVIKNADVEELKIFNCIFTASINRILVDLMTKNQHKERNIIDSIIKMYANMGNRAKAQAVYILGRASSPTSKEHAKDFLKKEFEELSSNLDDLTKSQDQAMLYRSVGISLIYLGVYDHENSFYHSLIYDEVIKQININFHIAYYSNSTYKVGDDVSLDSQELCTDENLKRLYSMLWTSVTGEKQKNSGKRNINIITLFSLYIRMLYPLDSMPQEGKSVIGVDEQESFVTLLNALLTDYAISNTEILTFLNSIREFIDSPNVYVDALSKIYGMKTIPRGGWKKEGREVEKKNVRIESDADHTWACCMLANVFLSDRINDCVFLSEEEKNKYAESYNLDRVIRLLLVHDLPEIYTGDIPAGEQDPKQKQAAERKAMQSLAVLDSFPQFNSFSNISELWNEYEFEKKESINAKLAFQIDQIEPLIQVFLYRDAFPDGQKCKQRKGKLFAPYFAPGASIINISSSRDRMSQPQTESYSAAKGGIAALTHALAVSFSGKVQFTAANGRCSVSERPLSER